MRIHLPLAQLRRVLLLAFVIVAAAGLTSEFARHVLEVRNGRYLVSVFSLSNEDNFPTWYSGCILFLAAILLAVTAAGVRQRGGRHPRHWAFLSCCFLYISLDEFVTIHEDANAWFQLSGVLTYSWILPAAAIVTIMGICYLRFLADLPTGTRRAFILAGGIYVTGALLMEMPLGWWTTTHGSSNMGYALIDFVEESMEMIGVNLFILALVSHLGGGSGRLVLRLDSDSAPQTNPSRLSA